MDGQRANGWTAASEAAPSYDTYRQPPPGNGGFGAAPPGAAPPPALTPEAVFESIQKLSNRIEQADQRTAETIKPLAERVERLSEQMQEVKTSSGISSAPVERAIMRMAERMDRLEGTPGSRRDHSRPAADAGEERPSQTSQDSGGLLHRLFGRD